MSLRVRLRELASHCGILDGFHDWQGHWRDTGDDTRVALLRGMGIDGSSEAAAETALASLRNEDAVAPRTAVLSTDGTIDVGNLEIDADDLSLVLRDEREEETRIEARCESRDGRRLLRIEEMFRPEHGYYEIEIRRGAAELARSALLVVPERGVSVQARSGFARQLGVMANLYSLASEDSWGIGDFGDVRIAAERLASLGVGFIGLSPVHTTGNRGSGTSPYYPSSRRFVNPLYLDVTATGGYVAAAASLSAGEASDVRLRLDRLRTSDRLDRGAVMALKLRVLEAAFSARSKSERRAAEAYCRREGDELDRFAAYEALAEELSRESAGEPDWRAWPVAYRDPASRETGELVARLRTRVDFHRWLQHEADRQLEAAGAPLNLGLFLDLAVGTAPGGAETWAHREAFARDVELGCPPDDYSAVGQCWGLAPLEPRSLRRTRYRHLRSVLAASFRHAGALRIDHAMGFVRQFWVPAGEPAAHGGYVVMPAAEMLAVLAIESANAGAVVVAEDLGTVPDGFRDELARRGWLRTQILYFERDGDGAFRGSERYAEHAFVAANNHDLPPLAGYGRGADLEVRATAHRLPAGHSLDDALAERGRSEAALAARLAQEGVANEEDGAHASLLAATTRFLLRTPAEMIGVALDDLGGESDPVNVPDIVSTERPAWTRRMKQRIEDILDAPANASLLEESATVLQGATPLPIDGCLDLHTFPPREIAPLMRDYVKECRRRGVLELRVVHGKGTGSLRRTVESLLPRIDGVTSWRGARTEEGGWGATIVTLRPLGEDEEGD